MTERLVEWIAITRRAKHIDARAKAYRIGAVQRERGLNTIMAEEAANGPS